MVSESRLPHRASIPFDPKSHRPRRELVTRTMATSLMEKFDHLLFVTGRRADPGKCLSHLADEVSSDYARTAAKQNRAILLRSVEKLFSYCCLTNWLFRISGDSRTSVRVTDLTFVVYFLFSRIYSSLHQASHSVVKIFSRINRMKPVVPPVGRRCDPLAKNCAQVNYTETSTLVPLPTSLVIVRELLRTHVRQFRNAHRILFF